jgi:adenylate cyclase class 2
LKTHLSAPRTFEVNLRFDTPKGDMQHTGRVLRLRKDDAARLTYKDNSQHIDGAVTRREIEFVVDDFDLARQFVEALGYKVVFIYEKYRTTFEIPTSDAPAKHPRRRQIFRSLKTHIMLDELPYGNFIEIEGELEMLRPAAEQLQLDWDKAIPASYHALFERLCKSRKIAFHDLTFENFKGVKVSPDDMMVEYADHKVGT